MYTLKMDVKNMRLFVKKEKMNMKTGRFEPTNYKEKPKKKMFHGSPIYKSMKPQIRELKEKEKMQRLENKIKRLNQRDRLIQKKSKIRQTRRSISKRQMEPYVKAGKKIVKSAKGIENWANSFDKPQRSRSSGGSRKGKSKTVLMVDSSGRIIGSKKVRSKSRSTRSPTRSSGGSDISVDYFIGSSKGSGKRKNNKSNKYDNIGGWI